MRVKKNASQSLFGARADVLTTLSLFFYLSSLKLYLAVSPSLLVLVNQNKNDCTAKLNYAHSGPGGRRTHQAPLDHMADSSCNPGPDQNVK